MLKFHHLGEIFYLEHKQLLTKLFVFARMYNNIGGKIMKTTEANKNAEQERKLESVCEKKMAKALKKGNEEKAKKLFNAFLEYLYGPDYKNIVMKTFYSYDEKTQTVEIHNVGLCAVNEEDGSPMTFAQWNAKIKKQATNQETEG